MDPRSHAWRAHAHAGAQVAAQPGVQLQHHGTMRLLTGIWVSLVCTGDEHDVRACVCHTDQVGGRSGERLQ